MGKDLNNRIMTLLVDTTRKDFSAKVLSDLIELLTRSFSIHFEVQVKIIETYILEHEACGVRLWASPKIGELLSTEWFVLLGATILEKGASADAVVLPVVNGKRVKTCDGYDFIDIRFQFSDEETGKWVVHGWKLDEHYEYMSIDTTGSDS